MELYEEFNFEASISTAGLTERRFPASRLCCISLICQAHLYWPSSLFSLNTLQLVISLLQVTVNTLPAMYSIQPTAHSGKISLNFVAEYVEKGLLSELCTFNSTVMPLDGINA